jgi:hypothetical protein
MQLWEVWTGARGDLLTFLSILLILGLIPAALLLRVMLSDGHASVARRMDLSAGFARRSTSVCSACVVTSDLLTW